jgi:hypothetical protein
MCSAFNKDVQKGVDVTVDGVRGICRLGKHFLRCVPAIDSTCRPIKIHISSLAPISGATFSLPHITDRALVAYGNRMPSPTGSGSVYDLKERYAGRMIPVDANLCLDDDCTASTSSASTSTKRSASECVSDEPERCVLSRSSSFASACSNSTESVEEEAELLLGFYTSALDLLAITAVDEAERSPRCRLTIVKSMDETMRHELSLDLHPASPSACSPRPRLARRAIRFVAPTQC